MWHLAGPQPTPWLAQFGRFRRLWYNFLCEFLALQGWRRGARSRSLRGTETSNNDEKWEEGTSIVLGLFSLSFWIYHHLVGQRPQHASPQIFTSKSSVRQSPRAKSSPFRGTWQKQQGCN
jgi:hypothetical protein